MATRSHILAWKIPRTEDPGGLQSVGSPRVRHKRACTDARSRAKSRQRAETSIQFGFKKKKKSKKKKKKKNIFTGLVPAQTGKTRESEQSLTNVPRKAGGRRALGNVLQPCGKQTIREAFKRGNGGGQSGGAFQEHNKGTS